MSRSPSIDLRGRTTVHVLNEIEFNEILYVGKEGKERERCLGCRAGNGSFLPRKEVAIRDLTQRLTWFFRCLISRDETMLLCAALSLYVRRTSPVCFIASLFLASEIFFKLFFY